MTSKADSPRRWRGMDRAERDAQRRSRLVEAALHVFGTVGYAASTIDMMCVEAGVATRSFYELFGSREALLRAVYDEIIGAVAADMTAVLGRGDPPEQVVRAAVAAYLVPLAGDERKGRITQLEVVGVGELETYRRTVIRRFTDLVTRRLEAWMESGAVPRQELGMLPLIMVGGVSEALVDHLIQPAGARPTVDSLVREVSRVWLAVLRIEAPPDRHPQRS